MLSLQGLSSTRTFQSGSGAATLVVVFRPRWFTHCTIRSTRWFTMIRCIIIDITNTVRIIVWSLLSVLFTMTGIFSGIIVRCSRWSSSRLIVGANFSHIHRVFHTIYPEWPACHPQGGGWQATRLISRVNWLWRHRQTRRNGNVVRLDSSNFPTFTSEKYLFEAYRRKIINIYCPLVTEKLTNPRVKFTCPCLGKPRHGLSEFDTRVSWFLSHHRTIDVDSINPCRCNPRYSFQFRLIYSAWSQHLHFQLLQTN